MNSSQSEDDGQQTTYRRLIEERNLAFREVEPGGSPIETFLRVWPHLEPHYGTMVEQLKNALEGALSVRCTVSARVKSLSSITKSIERRQIHRGKQYKEVNEIFDDLHDLAGFRIVVDYPSGIQIAKSFITQNFQLKSSNVFKADREVSDTWKPTFGSFQSENHHVLLHPDAKYPLSPFCGILFEIQILSLAESLYNRLAHPLLYKKSSSQSSIIEEKMIDVTHGLSLCYWICLSCMEDRLEGKETQEIPIVIHNVAQMDGDQNADMESLVKATPYSMPESRDKIPIKRCLDFVKDLSNQAMTSDQLHSQLSVLLNGSTQTSTANAYFGSGHIVQNCDPGSNNTIGLVGDFRSVTIAKDDTADEIRNAFWVTDAQSHKEDIQERKGGLIKDSYRWILQDKQFTQWYEQECSLLWVNGDPGKGKTMSVCGIIDHIGALSDSTTVLSYFFCDASDSNLNSVTSVLRGIVYSLISQNSMALSYVQQRFKGLGKPLSVPKHAFGMLQEILDGILFTIKDRKTYLIIDAIDECRQGQEALLELILRQSSLLSVKWLISSRKSPIIKEILMTYPKLSELSFEDNETNVSAAVGFYISHQVESLSTIKRYDQKRKETIELYLRSKSSGTFLWVSFVCQMLKETPAWAVMQELRKPPAGLATLYGRMVEQIQPSSGEEGDELCTEIVSLVLTAFRPLSLDELYSLLDSEEIDIKGLEDIVVLCGSFLTIRRRVVYFIHDSAKDYLLVEASGFKFNSRQQHAVLFSRSLRNMTQSLKRDILYLESNDTRTVQEGIGYISYQCLFWISHLVECEPSTRKRELMDGSPVDNFMRQKFPFWLEALGHLQSIDLGIVEMLKLERMLNHTSQLKALVQEEMLFMRHHRHEIERSPLQVYGLLNSSPYQNIRRMLYGVNQSVDDYPVRSSDIFISSVESDLFTAQQSEKDGLATPSEALPPSPGADLASLWSEGASMMSTAPSSLLQGPRDGVGLLAALLFDNDDLGPLYSEARTKVTPKKLARHLHGFIREYGTGLIREAEPGIQKQAAEFVSNHAIYMAKEIIALLDAKVSDGQSFQLPVGPPEKTRQMINKWLVSARDAEPTSELLKDLVVEDPGNEEQEDIAAADGEDTPAVDDSKETYDALELAKDFLLSAQSFRDLEHAFRNWVRQDEVKATIGQGSIVNRQHPQEDILALATSEVKQASLVPDDAGLRQRRPIQSSDSDDLVVTSKSERQGSTAATNANEEGQQEFLGRLDANLSAVEETPALVELERQGLNDPAWARFTARVWYGLMGFLDRSPIGSHRVTYTCECGDLQYLDVEELTPGGAAKFQQAIRDASNTVRQHVPTPNVGTSNTTTMNQSGVPAISSGNQLGPGIPSLPYSPASSSALGTRALVGTSQYTVACPKPMYLLICINTKYGYAKLGHVDVSTIEDDQNLFEGIRKVYYNARREHDWGIARFMMEKLCSRSLFQHFNEGRLLIPKRMEFAQFRLHPVRTEICTGYMVKPRIPDREEMQKEAYEYQPVPHDVTVLKIDAHALLKPGRHLDSFWRETFPKKLKSKLEYVQGVGPPVGWGIHISEDWNKPLTALLIFLLVGLFTGFVIVYGILTKDWSTGATIGSFIVALYAIYCTLHYQWWRNA